MYSDLTKIGAKIENTGLVEDELACIIKNIDYIWHLAFQPDISSDISFDTYYSNNIQATYKLLE